MTPPTGLRSFVIPAQAGIHLSACRSLPGLRERRGALPKRDLAPPWIPAFAGMTVVFGQAWAHA